MKTKTIKTTVLAAVIAALLLFTTGCLDILAFKSRTRVIKAGKGDHARHFKTGTYRFSEEDTKPAHFQWDKKNREYTITIDGSKPQRFTFKHLRKKFYLLQAYHKEEDYYEYALIKITKNTFGFLNIKDKYKEKLPGLWAKYGLTQDEEELLDGSRADLSAFFKFLVKSKYLTLGERLIRQTLHPANNSPGSDRKKK